MTAEAPGSRTVRSGASVPGRKPLSRPDAEPAAFHVTLPGGAADVTFGRYLIGLRLVAASLAPLLGGGRFAGLLPSWTGAPARLAEALIAVSA